MKNIISRRVLFIHPIVFIILTQIILTFQKDGMLGLRNSSGTPGSVSTTIGFGKICLDVCTCDDEVERADCSNNNLTEIPMVIFNITEIDLSDNSISVIKNTDFIDCEYVETLKLNRNGIKHLDENTFENLDELRYLYLTENKIENIPQNLIMDLSLQKLCLRGNPLIIPSGQFLISFSLTVLDMSLCNITNFPEDCFIGLPMLTELLLDGNNFTHVDTKTFESLLDLKEISMESGTIECLTISNFTFFSSNNIMYHGPGFCRLEVTVAQSTLTSPSNLSYSVPTYSETATEGLTIYTDNVISLAYNTSPQVAIQTPNYEIFIDKNQQPAYEKTTTQIQPLVSQTFIYETTTDEGHRSNSPNLVSTAKYVLILSFSLLCVF